MKRLRIILRVFVLLVLAAIVNVAVAWGCAIGSTWEDFDYAKPERARATSSWQRYMPPNCEPVIHVDSRGELNDFGARWMGIRGRCACEATVSFIWEFQVGWPWFAMSGQFWIHEEVPKSPRWQSVFIMDAACIHDLFRDPVFGPTLPLGPLWPGFVFNTLFYAAILWLLFFIPGRVRRRRRINRGLCLACGYPAGSNEVCTECGTPVPNRIKEHRCGSD